MMATMNAPPTSLRFKLCSHATVDSNHVHVPFGRNLATVNLFSTNQSLDGRILKSYNSHKGLNSFVRPLLAAEPGVAASISDENVVTVKNANVLVESQDDDKMQVKVELPGKETQIVFDKVLANLARTAPPVPGFRRQKGGKTSKVPKSFLLSIIGEDRVTKFVIQEIVSSTMADYVKKNNIPVKDNRVNTIQSIDELQSSFSPGIDFGFNATLELEKELEKPDDQTSSSDSSEA
ncbi:putative trigger factor [Helianthus annuus]|nr:putative trigger factor [Helianthus annuus]KAJ0716827.1 putative trigger factor [Helianthus annuus]KAJ0851004.1 putative trigger factor [Helianthus annuus]